MRIRTGIRRTTTQMLNNGRRRTGLAGRQNSLVNTLMGKNTNGMSRLSALNANSAQSARIAKVGYEKLQKSANSLAEQTKLLAEKADTGGKDIASATADVVTHFNNTMKYLRDNGGVLNDYYLQTLKGVASGNKANFEEIGITVAADGSLTLNKDKLAAADGEKVKKVLGSAGDFARQVDVVAGRVADNARASAESAASQYNSSGNLANSYLSRYSKYNFRG